MKKNLVLFLIIAVVLAPVMYFTSGLDVYIRTIINSAVAVIWTGVAYQLIDRYFPSPHELTLDEVKSFLTSKVFWLAFLNLLIVSVSGLFGVEFDPEVGSEIVSLDWGNIGQALISVVLLVLRKTDIFKRIK